jgi:hypothetical protein
LETSQVIKRAMSASDRQRRHLKPDNAPSPTGAGV